MSVPKKRRSKARVRSNHAGKGKVIKANLIKCPNCQKPKQPHTICRSCGQYKSRQAVNVERRAKRLERKQRRAK